MHCKARARLLYHHMQSVLQLKAVDVAYDGAIVNDAITVPFFFQVAANVPGQSQTPLPVNVYVFSLGCSC